MKELPKQYNPKQIESSIYKTWQDKGLFKASESKDKEPYTIVIPPPNITGILHMGHALNNTIQDILIMNKHKDLIKIYYGLGKINFTDDILDELGISQEMRIEKPGKIEDYEERDVMVNKAVRAVKARKKAEHQAFKKMAEEMRENEEKFDNQKED